MIESEFEFIFLCEATTKINYHAHIMSLSDSSKITNVLEQSIACDQIHNYNKYPYGGINSSTTGY